MKVKIIGGPNDGKVAESVPSHATVLYLVESTGPVHTVEVERPVQREWRDGHLVSWQAPMTDGGWNSFKLRRLEITSMPDRSMAVHWYGRPR